MTSYYAYDAGLPCKNPSCKSHGKPHPNCRCYGDHAEGGDVSFCSQDRAHNKDCEYFSDGGQVDFDSLQEDSAPKFDDLKEDSQPSANDFDSLVDDEQKYSTPGQSLGAAAEGFSQGILGPLAPAAEMGLSGLGVPGMAKEDIAGRQKANPIEHGLGEVAGLAGSMFVGTGEAALASKAAQALAKFSGLGKAGSAIIKGAITNGLIQGSDEITKGILGQGDPDHAIAAGLMHTGAAGLFGAGAGALGAGVSTGLEKIAESKLAGKIMGYVAGVGSAANTPAAERELSNSAFKAFFDKSLAPTGMSYKDFLSGQKYFDAGLSASTKMAGPELGSLIGRQVGGEHGAMMGTILGYGLTDKIKSLLVPAARKYVTPITLKILSSGGESATGLLDMFEHAGNVASGYGSMGKALDSLFKGTAMKSLNEVSTKSLDKLDDYIKNGGVDQDVQQQIYDNNESQGFAKGGEVMPVLKQASGMETHYPEQNLMLNVAKGRVSNYLKSLRPSQTQPRLIFDTVPDNRVQEKSYRKALGIAVNPLRVMDEIRKGTVEPDDIKHLNSLYPEVSGLLQKQITERITKAQIDGSRPSYKVRQGLSMFMGTALSGELTPQGIQAAQSVFIQKQKQQAQGQPAGPSKKSTTSLTKSDDSFLTNSQSLVSRKQRA